LSLVVAIIHAPSLSRAAHSGIAHPSAVVAAARKLVHWTGYTAADLRPRLRFCADDKIERAVLRLHAAFLARHRRLDGKDGAA
jgi:hypothetical protein